MQICEDAFAGRRNVRVIKSQSSRTTSRWLIKNLMPSSKIRCDHGFNQGSDFVRAGLREVLRLRWRRRSSMCFTR